MTKVLGVGVAGGGWAVGGGIKKFLSFSFIFTCYFISVRFVCHFESPFLV